MPYHRAGQAAPAACPAYVKEVTVNTMIFHARNPVCFQQRTYTPFRCRARVVAKSAQLRFRLRRKLRSLPCSSFPHKVCDFAGTPRVGRCVLRTRWGAALPKPLAHPQKRNTRFASVPFLRVRYRQRQIGAHVENASLASLGFCRGSV